jgi:hypothetical protein
LIPSFAARVDCDKLMVATMHLCCDKLMMATFVVYVILSVLKTARRGGVAECEPCLSFLCPIPGSRGGGFIEVQLVA